MTADALAWRLDGRLREVPVDPEALALREARGATAFADASAAALAVVNDGTATAFVEKRSWCIGGIGVRLLYRPRVPALPGDP